MRIKLNQGEEITIESEGGDLYRLYAYNNGVIFVNVNQHPTTELDAVEQALIKAGSRINAIAHLRQEKFRFLSVFYWLRFYYVSASYWVYCCR